MKKVLLVTALLGITACATNIDFDMSNDEPTQPAGTPAQDAMVENNQQIIEDARERGELERN